MPNMSYCRFQNTYADVEDCTDAVEAREELSESELRYAKAMYKACKEFVTQADRFGFMADDEERTLHFTSDLS